MGESIIHRRSVGVKRYADPTATRQRHVGPTKASAITDKKVGPDKPKPKRRGLASSVVSEQRKAQKSGKQIKPGIFRSPTKIHSPGAGRDMTRDVVERDSEEHAQQSEKHVAPPGMEHVVKRLKGKKGVDNPYAVAWSMHDREKNRHSEQTIGVTRIDPQSGTFQRHLKTLDYVSKGKQYVDPSVIDSMHSDAVADLERFYRPDDVQNGISFYELWRHVLDQTAREAKAAIRQRHSVAFGRSRIDAPQTLSDRYDLAYAEQGVPEPADEDLADAMGDGDYDQTELQEEVSGEGSGLDHFDEEDLD